jgi:predicted CopG family antitoxin
MITINIEDKVWEHLNKQKKAGETFNQVLIRLLNIKKEEENDNL